MQRSLPQIIVSASRLTLKAWFLLFFLFLFRFAAGFAGLFPVVLLFSLFLRLMFSASTMANMGFESYVQMLFALASSPANRVATAALIAIAMGFQFLLTTLADAGITGELARAYKAQRPMTIKGFFDNALRLFGRVMAMKIFFGFGLAGIGIVAFGMLAALLFLILPQNDGFAAMLGAITYGQWLFILVVFGCIGFVFYAIVMLYFTAILATIATDGFMLSVAIGKAWRYLVENILEIFAVFVFCFFLAAMLLGVNLFGALWLAVAGKWSDTSFLPLATTAWDIAFVAFMEFFLLFTFAAQLILYQERTSEKRV